MRNPPVRAGGPAPAFGRALLACALALPLAGAARGAGRGAEAPVELQLSPYAQVLRTVSGRIGGFEGPFLLDTGGGLTLISRSTAKAVGCTPFGRGTGFRHDGGRIDAQRGGPLELRLGAYTRRGEVGVYDLDSLLAGMPPIAGVVSLETFSGRVVTLDLAHERLVVETPASLRARTRVARELDVRIGRQVAGAALDVYMAVEGRHGPLWLEMDCGNVGSVLLAPHAWAELGLEPPAAGSSSPVALPVRGLGNVDCRAASREMIYDGLLDSDFFRRHVVTFDLANGRAWASAVN